MSAKPKTKARRSNLTPDELEELSRQADAGQRPKDLDDVIRDFDPATAPLPPGERPSRESTLRMLRGGDPNPERDNAVPMMTINTIIDRPFIVVNGKPHDLKVASDLSLTDRARAANLERRVAVITGKTEDFTQEDLSLLDELTMQLAMMCMYDAEGADAVARIGFTAQQEVIRAFRISVAGMVRRRPEPADQPVQADQQTSESSSPSLVQSSPEQPEA